MLTRSVAACILSGALASTMLPDGPLVTPAHAKKIAVKKVAKASRPAVGVRATAAVSVPHERRKRLLSQTKVVKVGVAAHRPSSARQRATKRATSTKYLGTFTVRAYTHYRRPGARLSKTATGTIPTAGRTVAVDPHVIPLGSKIHIEGVGERIAEDSGGKIKGKKLDLFLPSVEHCRQFGVRLHNVQLLDE